MLLCSPDGQVLLLEDSDRYLPESEKPTWWVLPGGGIDPGESPEQAAVREVFEETGAHIEQADLRLLATRTVVHGYSDHVLVQHEHLFTAQIELFEPDQSGFTESELLSIHDWGWFDQAQVARLRTWPPVPELVAQARRPNAEPLDLGVVEESTVPVSDALRASINPPDPDPRHR